MCHVNENEPFKLEEHFGHSKTEKTSIYLPNLELETTLNVVETTSLLWNKFKRRDIFQHEKYQAYTICFKYNKKRFLVIFQCCKSFPCKDIRKLVIESFRSIRIDPPTYFETLVENKWHAKNESMSYYSAL